VDEVEAALRARRDEALAAGVDASSLLLDPCFGFGKDTASDVALVAALPRLRALGTPLLAACSHKEFTADATGLDEDDLRGTLAAAVLCARGGADVLRLHDVAEVAPALRLADAVRRAAAGGG
jgi:dihydropteroate synthase